MNERSNRNRELPIKIENNCEMKFEQLSNFICENFVFDAKFDSGNLGKVEYVKSTADLIEKQNVIRAETAAASTSGCSSSAEALPHLSNSSKDKDRPVDAEFNLWTRPDCQGTAFENGNRTWFYFSVRGGEKNQLVKFNVMNLNKQAKLFSQGMHPVVKFGSNGKWERMKEKPTFYVTDENFILSFFHKTSNHENIEDNLTFYAFTFPFTYTEQLDLLNTYDKKYEKSDEELQIIVRELNGPKKDKLVINMNQDFMEDEEEENFMDLKQEILDVTEDSNAEVPTKVKELVRSRSSKEIDENTSESMQQLSNLVNVGLKIEKLPPRESMLAYIAQDVRTRIDQVKDDIYYYRELLITSYEQRRIDLITITSFHGIEDKREERLKNLFPDYSKPRCHTFKDKKIIFISSRVHPGETPASFVLNGFVNLLLDRKNQVASVLRKLYVFKIVPFLNPDGVYNGLYRSDTLGHNLNRVYLNPRLDSQPSIYAVRKMIRYFHHGFDKPDNVDEIGQPINCDDCTENNSMMSKVDQENDFFDESDTKIEVETAVTLDPVEVEPEEKVENQLGNEEDIDMDFSCDQAKPILTAPHQDVKPKNQERRSQSQPLTKLESIIDKKQTMKSKPSTSYNKLKETATNVKNMVKDKKSSAKGEGKSKIGHSANRHQHHHYKHYISHYNSEKQQKAMQQQYFSPQPHQGLNISMDFRLQTDDNGEKSIVEENSNLFLYLDLHGHASKKGVFMYGNSLPNTLEAVEVMLLPKLMSMNCHHFAFDACNFSERNMYLKGKRDGLSKEGSGRVAVYKSTGLIKSYTLESNYNMAKSVNILPPKGKEVSCKIHNLIPPKFTPAIFEEVGRALGPSILDLTNSNPCSRIINSEFRSLQGLRNALKNEISRGLSKARVSKFTKASKKRQTTITLPATTSAQDMLKENKVTSPSNSSSSQQQISKAQTLSQGPKILGTKIKTVGKIQAFSKKDVNVLSSAKKKKVLCDTTTSVSSSVGTTVNQIPRKKIKVSNVINLGAGNKGDSQTQPQTSENELSKYFLATSNEDMIPCCSKNISSFLTKAPSSPGSSSSTSSTGQKITSFLPIKKLAKTRKLKFTKISSRISGKKIVDETQSSAPLDDSCVSTGAFQSLSSPSSKLLKKKKRPLKSLKKRSQKPLLH